MRARMLACGAVAGLAALAPLATATRAPAPKTPGTRSGVMVDWRASSHTATVALRGGRLLAVHTARRMPVGSRVRFGVLRQLQNGTLAGVLARSGSARTALVRGTVIANLGGGIFAIGARGTTFFVQPRSRGGALIGSHGVKFAHELGTSDGPAVGSTVSATVAFGAHGDLRTVHVSELAPADPTQTLDLEGTVTAVDPTAGRLTVTVQDDGRTADFTVVVPGTIDITTYAVGDEVEFTVTPNADGTFTLDGSSLNGDDAQADDATESEGDQPAVDAPWDGGDQSQPGDATGGGTDDGTTTDG